MTRPWRCPWWAVALVPALALGCSDRSTPWTADADVGQVSEAGPDRALPGREAGPLPPDHRVDAPIPDRGPDRTVPDQAPDQPMVAKPEGGVPPEGGTPPPDLPPTCTTSAQCAAQCPGSHAWACTGGACLCMAGQQPGTAGVVGTGGCMASGGGFCMNIDSLDSLAPPPGGTVTASKSFSITTTLIQ